MHIKDNHLSCHRYRQASTSTIITTFPLVLILISVLQLQTVNSFIPTKIVSVSTSNNKIILNKYKAIYGNIQKVYLQAADSSQSLDTTAINNNNNVIIQKRDHEHADSPVYGALSVNTAFSNYKALYTASIQDPSSFWTTQARKYITWFQPPPLTHPALHGNFEHGDFTFFAGGKLNVCYNAIDRHVYERNGEDIAMIWEGDEPTDVKTYTYNELLQHVSRIANALKSQGVQKGDVVTIYMPMIPELPMTMLACARIGAPHSVSD